MKKLIIGIALVAVGTFAQAQQRNDMHTRSPQQMEQRRAENLKKMQSDLDLSEAQVAKLRTVQDAKWAERRENAPKMRAERRAKMQAMKAKRMEYDKEVKGILAPEQYTKWKAMNQQKMQNKKQMVQQNRMRTRATK